MKTVLYILLAVLAILLAAVLIAVIRTLLLKPKKTYFALSDDTERMNEYSEKLSKMVQVETVSSREDPQVEKFRAFHKTMEELFPTVFEKLEKIEIDGNLMMRWRGTDPTLAPIILISHMDVVPAEGEWKYPPFSGTIAEGKIWGRGAGDIKEGLMCFYQAAEELLKEGYTPKCDVYLGSSCTEEIGGDGAPKLAAWFKERGIKLFMLCDEGGGIVQNPVAGVKGNFAAVGIFEKGYGDLKFTARSPGGHSSTRRKTRPSCALRSSRLRWRSTTPSKCSSPPRWTACLSSLPPIAAAFR